MTRRPYRLGQRAETADHNHQRILDAAYELIAEAGFHPVSVDAVADRAGVTRVTVYRHFGSKRGLLEAVSSHRMDQAQLARLDQARTHPDVVTALRDFLRESCRLMSEIGETLRTSLEVARHEPEVAHVLDIGYYGRRQRSLEELATRLHDEHALASGWTPRRVVDVLMIITSLEAFETLTQRQGYSVRRAAGVLFDMTNGFLASAPAGRSGSGQPEA
jgi:AcrR family transcriptional regulator